MELRPYQARVVAFVHNVNAIVKMPTGSGKTIVAAEVVKRHLEKGAPKQRALFLVPTCDLVDQQARVLERWCTNVAVGRFMGGLGDPYLPNLGVLVSTPQSFLALQSRKRTEFGWSNFSLCVFDEVHHVLKDHPYRIIALSLKDWSEDHDPVQVLGLSASLTYHVQEHLIRETLARLTDELQIQKIESPSLVDLESGGYVPQHGREVELEAARETPEGVCPEASRKPHLMHEIFMTRIEQRSATAFSMKVWETISALETHAKQLCDDFVSPLEKSSLSSWDNYAHAIGSKNHRFSSFFHKLECWYVALRVLVMSWEEEEQLVMQWLKMNDAFNIPVFTPTISAFHELHDMVLNPNNQYKLSCLHSHLVRKKEKFGDAFRCIVFVEQRLKACVLADYIDRDEELSLQYALKAGYVASRGSKISASIKVTKGAVSKTIRDFRDGKLNVLVATSVIEEGFDVPAANVVISYDKLKNSVELCQRFGRARQEECSIVVLDERRDRPLDMLHAVHQTQEEIVQKFDPSTMVLDKAAETVKQKSRERAAFRSVLADRAKWNSRASAALNEYVKKTKAALDETMRSVEGGFECTIKLTTRLRTLRTTGRGRTKKQGRNECALSLLCQLFEQTNPDNP